MKFRKKETQARQSSAWLVTLFTLAVIAMVFVTNGIFFLVWKIATYGAALPAGFFESNTFLVLFYVFGSCFLETLIMKKGGVVLAQRAGAIEVDHPDNIYQKRLCNVVLELAVATGITPPKVYLLSREDAINGFAAGWDTNDAVITLTQGAIERLTRDELQGIVAHEFSHILNGDMRLNMRLMSMVLGLQMLYHYGQSWVGFSKGVFVVEPMQRGRGNIGVMLLAIFGFLLGYSLMAAGWIGWLGGALLSAGVSRQREYLADASAVRYTRMVDGIAGALRKIAYQQMNDRAQLKNEEQLSQMAPLFLHFDDRISWFATHPTIAQRLKNLGVSYKRFEQKDDVQYFKRDEFIPERLFAAGELTPHLKMAAARWGGLTVKTADVVIHKSQHAMTIDVPQGDEFKKMQAELYLSRDMNLGELQAAILAFWVPLGDEKQEEQWKHSLNLVKGTQIPYKILLSVQEMAPNMREPMFEELAMKMQVFDLNIREELVERAKRLYLNENSFCSMRWLHLAVLTYWMGEFRESMSNKYKQLKEVQGSVALVSSFVANALSLDASQVWVENVLSQLGLTGTYQENMSEKELDLAVRDIHDGVSIFAPILMKVWFKAWQEASAKHPLGQTQHALDVFRLMCALLDTVCPEEVLSHYPSSSV